MADDKKSKKKKDLATLLLLSLLIGAAAFFVVFGFDILDPGKDAWLLGEGEDLTQHYLGWKAYRSGAWLLPPGAIDTLAYPLESSVIFTDSIPIAALIGKILSPFLPETFQYFGIYGLLCFMLQGLFAALLARKYLRSNELTLIAVGFFAFMPALLHRMFYHTALGSHYLILAALCLIVYRKELQDRQGTKKFCVLHLFLVVLLALMAAGTHIYLLAMCGMVVLLDAILYGAEQKAGEGILELILFVAFPLLEIKFLGGFSSYFESGGGGLGKYGLNLNALFNPQGWSKFLGNLPMPAVVDRTESFAYLGLGVIVLLTLDLMLLLFLHLVQKKAGKRQFPSLFEGKLKKGILLVYMAGILMFAFSPMLWYNNHLVLELHFPEVVTDLWSIFRATGRFAWVLLYPLLLFAIVRFVGLLDSLLDLPDGNASSGSWKREVAPLVLLLLLGLQILDLTPGMAKKKAAIEEHMTYESPLKDPIWDGLADAGIRHVYFVFSEADYNVIYPITDWAVDNGMTVNRFYFARKPDTDTVSRELSDALYDKAPDCLFIYREKKTPKEKMNYYETTDGLVLGWIGDFEGVSG